MKGIAVLLAVSELIELLIVVAVLARIHSMGYSVRALISQGVGRLIGTHITQDDWRKYSEDYFDEYEDVTDQE